MRLLQHNGLCLFGISNEVILVHLEKDAKTTPMKALVGGVCTVPKTQLHKEG